jgi:hypothetical protein
MADCRSANEECTVQGLMVSLIAPGPRSGGRAVVEVMNRAFRVIWLGIRPGGDFAAPESSWLFWMRDWNRLMDGALRL